MPDVRPRDLIPVDKSRDIRFLTILSSLGRGGTERAAVNYALGYRRAGFPSAVYAYGTGGVRVAQLQAEDIPVFLGSEDPAIAARALAEAKAWSPDILHLNRPGIADARSSAAVHALTHPRLRVFETNVFAYVDPSPDRVMIDLHLHLSRWCLWKWTQSAKDVSPRSPAVVVPYSVDASSFNPPTAEQKAANREAFGIPSDAFVFGRIGQPLVSKWSEDLISAFETVAKSESRAWLAVCGLPAALRAMVAKLPAGIRSRVVELPVTDSDMQLHRYYSVVDVFAHISQKGESFGMVLCEAMLSGIPVITMSTPLRDNSQIEVVPNGKAGIVVQNLQQLTKAMIDIQKDETAMQTMRNQARQAVTNRFDVPVVSRLLVKLATIALASNSNQDLVRCLSEDSEVVSSAPASLYKDLLRSAGLQPSLSERILTPLVNQPISRHAIDFARAVQSRLR